MKLNFKRKNVLITGVTSGIGKSLADYYFKNGANVIGTSTKKKLKKKNFQIHKVDFFNELEKKNFIKYISKLKVDILVNNAGINKIDKIQNINMSDFRKIINLNLEIPTTLSNIVSQNMIKMKSGKIINIASIFGNVSKSMRASYSSSKFGLKGLTRSTALDLAPFNILVNSVSPGFIGTRLTKKILKRKGILKQSKIIPLQRLGKVEEVSQLVLFLSSDYNTYITGQDIIIDGGFTSL